MMRRACQESSVSLKVFCSLHFMTPIDLHAFYDKRKSHFTDSLLSLNKRVNLISNIRLAVAVVFLVLACFAFSNHALFYVLPLVLLLFALLVRRHATLFDRKVHLENLNRIQQDELYALRGDFSHNSSSCSSSGCSSICMLSAWTS